MPHDRCDVCGAAPGLGETLAQESITFKGRRFYCPICHARFYDRIYAFMAFFTLMMVIGGIAKFGMQLQEPRHRFWLIVLMQWPLVIPHELGHAWMARRLGAKNVRILIGSGRRLFGFKWFGFEWDINLIPASGLTIVTDEELPWRRRDAFWFCAAGILVNLLLAVVILIGMGGQLFDGSWTLFHLFFWANILVVVENLIPMQVPTSYGSVPSDGLSLYLLLAEPGSKTERAFFVFRKTMRWIVAVFLLGIGLSIGALGWGLVAGTSDWVTQLFIIGLLGPFAGFIIYLAYRWVKRNDE